MCERIQDLFPANEAAESVADTAPETATTYHPREALDNVKRATIVALVRLGGSRRMAAREVGCHPATIARTAGRDPHFAERLAHAESLADHKALEVISRAQDQEKYWRAAAWVLERRNPDEFARRMPNTFTAEQVMEVIARLIRVLLPAVPEERRDEVMLEFNDTLTELTPLIGKASPDNRAAGSIGSLIADEDNLSQAQVHEIRRQHWERSEDWIRGLSDDQVYEVNVTALHRVHERGETSADDPWASRMSNEWHQRCLNRPVTYPFGISLPSSMPLEERMKIVEAARQKHIAQQAGAQQAGAQQTTELRG